MVEMTLNREKFWINLVSLYGDLLYMQSPETENIYFPHCLSLLLNRWNLITKYTSNIQHSFQNLMAVRQSGKTLDLESSELSSFFLVLLRVINFGEATTFVNIFAYL